MSGSEPILLVHGAWHGAWCWERTVAALAKLGREAVAIDLPGAGDDTTPLSDLTLARLGDRVAEALEAIGRPTVLVGHSFGGFSITLAAERAPQHVAALVYLAAFAPGPQQSLFGLAEMSGGLGARVRPVPDEAGLLQAFGFDDAVEVFYHDCDEASARAAHARLVALPASLFVTPARLPQDHAMRVPRHYIFCEEDRAIPVAAQHWMAEARGPMTTYSLPSAHSPFLNMPEELAAIFAGI